MNPGMRIFPPQVVVAARFHRILYEYDTSTMHLSDTEYLKRVMSSNHRWIEGMLHYDKDNIPEKCVVRLEAALAEANLDFDQLGRYSKVAHAMCVWARAMLRYHRCAAVVMPYRDFLRALEEELGRLIGFRSSPAVLA